jgi:phosphoglycolate phosphatase-like HAD superfamily hydrolase
MRIEHSLTVADLPDVNWMIIINPTAVLGHIRHAFFDFDGTISLIRRGWEDVMIPMMTEMICGESTPAPDIVREVETYVDRSTGVLTIKQMQWLVQTIKRHGLSRYSLSAYDYKKIYNERLLQPVQQRIQKLDDSIASRDTLMVKGARLFLQTLCEWGIHLYLASGTDHEYVVKESRVLDIEGYFEPHIYGALDTSTAFTKERIIQRIIDENKLDGRELAVIGDGPVEIRIAKSRGALAVGVAADEYKGCGFNPRKVKRLQDAQADFIVDGFEHYSELSMYLCGKL